MKDLLRKMLQGVANYHNDSSMELEEHYKLLFEDPREARLAMLFGHWFEDVVSMANYYNLDLVKRSPENEIIWRDHTVDTLLREGKHEVVEIPDAPSAEHWWYKGEWHAPESK